jgi:AraC-like DNA-binding protein
MKIMRFAICFFWGFLLLQACADHSSEPPTGNAFISREQIPEEETYSFFGRNDRESIDAYQYYQDVLRWAEKGNDTFHLRIRMDAYLGLGDISFSIGDHSQAEYFFSEAMVLAGSLDDTEQQAITGMKLGDVYRQKDSLHLARSYFFEALNHLGDSQLHKEIPSLLQRIADICIELEAWDECLRFLEDNMEVSRRHGGVQFAAHLHKAGLCSRELGLIPGANRFFNESLSFSLSVNDSGWVVKNHLELGRLWLETNHERAHDHLLRAESQAEAVNDPEALSMIYYHLSEVLERKDDYAGSLAYLQKHYRLNDSLFSLEKARQLKDIKQGYETERIDQEISALNQERVFKDEQIKTQRILIWGFALGITIISIFGVLLFFQNQRQNQTNMDLVRMNLEIVAQEKANVKKIEEMEARITRKKTELEALGNAFSQRLSALCLETGLVADESENDASKDVFQQFLAHSRGILQTLAPGLTPENTGVAALKSETDDLSNAEEDEPALARKILDVMENTREFQEIGFSLEQLASLVGSNKKEVSTVINDRFGMVFNSFVNKFRIKEARKMLLSAEYENYTIEAIAREVGFKSKSSFNLYFKKVTGLTPSFFQKTVKMANFSARDAVQK